jgi:hypothetical protein
MIRVWGWEEWKGKGGGRCFGDRDSNGLVRECRGDNSSSKKKKKKISKNLDLTGQGKCDEGGKKNGAGGHTVKAEKEKEKRRTMRKRGGGGGRGKEREGGCREEVEYTFLRVL